MNERRRAQGPPGAPQTDRRARGIAVYASQFGVPEDEVVELMTRRFGSRMTEEALHAGAEAWIEDVLSLRDRSLIVLAALVAQGGAEARLRPHVRWALDHGATPDELEAALALLAVYVGYPRASVGMEVVIEELERIGRPLDQARSDTDCRASSNRDEGKRR